MIDLGTGLGHFVRRARDRGWDCDGLELAPAAVRDAKELYGIDLINAPIMEFAAEPRYGVAALGQTLEHFATPGSVLEYTRASIIGPGGLLLIEVPHLNGLARRLRRERWLQWQPGDHVSFFTQATLRALLERSGYDVVATETTSCVYPGVGAALVANSIGVFDPVSGLGSFLRAGQRIAERRWSRSRPEHYGEGPAPLDARHGVLERGLLGLTAGVNKVGRGDHLRVLARAR
jgi:hypothetical protein